MPSLSAFSTLSTRPRSIDFTPGCRVGRHSTGFRPERDPSISLSDAELVGFQRAFDLNEIHRFNSRMPCLSAFSGALTWAIAPARYALRARERPPSAAGRALARTLRLAAFVTVPDRLLQGVVLHLCSSRAPRLCRQLFADPLTFARPAACRSFCQDFVGSYLLTP
jgi:hypothetical protein